MQVPRLPPEELRKLFHVLWSKAVGQPGYDKHEWIAMQHGLHLLAGLTPPPDVVEPEPWSGNGVGPH